MCISQSFALATIQQNEEKENDVVNSVFTLIQHSCLFKVFLYDADVIRIDKINFFGIEKFDAPLIEMMIKNFIACRK
jgi:hypothetical protein